MITDNWYKYLAVSFAYADQKGSNYLVTKDCTGNTGIAYCSKTLQSYLFPKEATTVRTEYNYGIVFGNGTSPPTKADYKLSGELITTISQVTASHSGKSLSDGVEYISTIVLSNTGTDDITITEVGWVGSFYQGGTSSKKILLDRTLLDEPVTIAPGSQGTVVYHRKVALPAA